jgi:hypothetical protein
MTNNPNTNYTFTGNGNFTFQFRDQAGNTGDATATVTWIDASTIQSIITYLPETPTSGNVQASISFNKTGITVNPPYEGGQGGSGWFHTFTGNDNFTFIYKDSFGNTGSSVAVVNWIDKTVPTCTVTYNLSANTNQDVIASLTNCSETITGTATSHTFTANGSYTFNFTDLVGNSGSTTATVSWINKTAIVPTITYSQTGRTNQDVTATISFNKTGVTVNPPFEGGQGGSGWFHTFTGNDSFTFTFRDDYGNQGNETALVSRIDKTAPTCSITYTPDTNTNGDVTAALSNCSETITGTTPSHTFTANGSYTFHFTDLVGNTGSTTATVHWIDKTAIIPTITYNQTGQTNQDVTATISFNKTGITVNPPYEGGQGGSGWFHTFTNNDSFTFTFHDDYGNTGSAIATVTRIDKASPILILSYSPSTATNQPVLVTLTTNEPVTKPVGWSGATTGTTFTKIYTGNTTQPITTYDLVGNQGQTWLQIDWIDTSSIRGTISYSTTSPTN